MDMMGSEVLPVPSRPVIQDDTGPGDVQQWTVGGLGKVFWGRCPASSQAPSPQPCHCWTRTELSTCRKTQAALRSQSHGGPTQHPPAESRQRAETPDPGATHSQQGARAQLNVRAAGHGARGPWDPQGLLALNLQDLPVESQPLGRQGQSQRGMPSRPRHGPGFPLRPGCHRLHPWPHARCPSVAPTTLPHPRWPPPAASKGQAPARHQGPGADGAGQPWARAPELRSLWAGNPSQGL